MSENLLDEYYKITKTIDNIQTKINNYKQAIEEQINNAKNDTERQQYITEYKHFIQNIKQDEDIKNKLIQLNKRQNELKTIIMTPTDINVIDVIQKLTNKYTILTNNTDIINNKYEQLINDIEKNLL
jgi:hypothetical protein